MKLEWMTFETFEKLYNIPATALIERCNLRKGLICVTDIYALKKKMRIKENK